jgi:PAS domain-containing protein
MNNSQKAQEPIDLSHAGATPGAAFRRLEHLAVPAFVLGSRGRVIVWNRDCEQLTRVPGHEVLGTADAWRGFHHDPRPTLADLVIQGRTQEAASLYDAHGVLCDESGHLSAESWCDMRRAGRRRYLAVDVSPIRDDMGRNRTSLTRDAGSHA